MPSTYTKQKGFNLIEVMVALVIFSIGLLGLAGLQVSGIRSNLNAFNYSLAVQQIYDMADRIRNNSGIDYAAVAPAAGDCVNSACNPGPMAAVDLNEWNTANGNLLPAGQGTITRNANTYTINVMWNEAGVPGGVGNCIPSTGLTDTGFECISIEIQI